MPKQDFIPRTNGGYINWHDNFKATLTATTSGATAADVTAVAADNTALHTKQAAANVADNNGRAVHEDLNSTIAASQKNVRSLARRIKSSTGYTIVLGDQLGVEGPEDATDMTQAQPRLQTAVKTAGVVEVAFDKKKAEGVHIYGMRDGESGYTLLASETHSAYVDNRPLLVAGKPETRNYKAIYFIGQAEIGLTSGVAVATAAP